MRFPRASTRSLVAEAAEDPLGLPGRLVGELVVEERGHAVQRGLVHDIVVGQRDQRLLDGALAKDQDQARHPLVDGHEVDAPDVRCPRLCRRRQTGRAGHTRQGGRREAEPVLACELHLPELVADHQLLDGRERHGIDDRLDVEAVAGVGRHATRRGMRVGQEAGALELGQDASDGRARHAEAVALDQRLRADGRRGGDIFLDDGPKDRLRAEVQGAGGAVSSRQGPVLLGGWHSTDESANEVRAS